MWLFVLLLLFFQSHTSGKPLTLNVVDFIRDSGMGRDGDILKLGTLWNTVEPLKATLQSPPGTQPGRPWQRSGEAVWLRRPLGRQSSLVGTGDKCTVGFPRWHLDDLYPWNRPINDDNRHDYALKRSWGLRLCNWNTSFKPPTPRLVSPRSCVFGMMKLDEIRRAKPSKDLYQKLDDAGVSIQAPSLFVCLFAFLDPLAMSP